MATANGYLTSLQSDLYVNGAEKDKIKKKQEKDNNE